jgi:CheY-like chemotaxis protein
MSDTIYYQYGANYGHLDDIQSAIQAAHECRENINAAFNALNSSGCYVGEAATALHAAHQQCSQQMDGILTDLQATQQQGVECQVNNAQLDGRCASNLT